MANPARRVRYRGAWLRRVIWADCDNARPSCWAANVHFNSFLGRLTYASRLLLPLSAWSYPLKNLPSLFDISVRPKPHFDRADRYECRRVNGPGLDMPLKGENCAPEFLGCFASRVLRFHDRGLYQIAQRTSNGREGQATWGGVRGAIDARPRPGLAGE